MTIIDIVPFYWAQKFNHEYACIVITVKVSPSKTYPLYGIWLISNQIHSIIESTEHSYVHTSTLSVVSMVSIL